MQTAVDVVIAVGPIYTPREQAAFLDPLPGEPRPCIGWSSTRPSPSPWLELRPTGSPAVARIRVPSRGSPAVPSAAATDPCCSDLRLPADEHPADRLSRPGRHRRPIANPPAGCAEGTGHAGSYDRPSGEDRA